MAELTNKLHIKQNNVVYECTSYSTEEEATPLIYDENDHNIGAAWPIKNNGINAYIGLWPVSAENDSMSDHSPLTITKDDIDYYVEKTVTQGFFITVIPSSNQTIQLTYIMPNGQEDVITVTTDEPYDTRRVPAMTGTTFTATVTADTGYDAGALNISSGTVDEDITINATAAALHNYTVTITQIPHNTITVTCNGTNYTSSFTAHYGDTWTAVCIGDTGYKDGTLNHGSSGTITEDVTITAIEAGVQTFAVTLAATVNQTITFKYTPLGGTVQTKTSTSSTQTFNVQEGSTWTATIAGATGYNAGTLSSSSGTITAAITVSATAATLKTYTLTKSATNASTNQTLTVKYAKATSSSAWESTTTLSSGSVTLTHFSKWWGTVSASTGWTAGKVTNPGGDSSRMSGNVTVSVAAATHITYTITLTQKANETVTIYYKNHNGSSLATSWSTATKSVTLGYGSKYYSTIAGSTYYSAGTITSPGTSSAPNTLNGNVTLSFTAATHITYTITLTQKTGETVTIHYKNHNGSSLASSWSTATKSVTLGYGSKYYCTIAASTGYTAGTITSPGTSSSPNTLTAAKTISFTAATAKKYTLYTDSSVNNGQYINGTKTGENWSGTFAYGTKITYKTDREWTKYKISVYKGNNAGGTLWMTKTTREFSFNMPASNVFVQDNCIDVGSSCSNCSCGA